MAERTHTRIAFQPPDNCRLGPVRVFGPTGELIRTIAVRELLTRPPAKPAPHGSTSPPREVHPERGPKAKRWSRA
jgi:hypothetical protein